MKQLGTYSIWAQASGSSDRQVSNVAVLTVAEQGLGTLVRKDEGKRRKHTHIPDVVKLRNVIPVVPLPRVRRDTGVGFMFVETIFMAGKVISDDRPSPRHLAPEACAVFVCLVQQRLSTDCPVLRRSFEEIEDAVDTSWDGLVEQ